MPILKIILINLAVLTIIFIAVWLVCEKLKNYGFIDSLWAMSIFLASLSYFCYFGNWQKPQIVFLILLGVWQIRLFYYLLKRSLRMHPLEDNRYKHFRQTFAKTPAQGLVIIFVLQAFLVWLVTMPVIFIAVKTKVSLSISEIISCIIFIIGIIGEIISDYQLSKFKQNPKNQNKILQRGLWKYSRHPNYFFEWVNWIALAIFAVHFSATSSISELKNSVSSLQALSWLSLIMPVLMLFFLIKKTGIYYTEKVMLEGNVIDVENGKKNGKRENYLKYRQKTRAFLPLPKLLFNKKYEKNN